MYIGQAVWESFKLSSTIICSGNTRLRYKLPELKVVLEWQMSHSPVELRGGHRMVQLIRWLIPAAKRFQADPANIRSVNHSANSLQAPTLRVWVPLLLNNTTGPRHQPVWWDVLSAAWMHPGSLAEEILSLGIFSVAPTQARTIRFGPGTSVGEKSSLWG